MAGSEAGWTPYRIAPHLGAELGLSDLWIKDETANPSGSFKDRVVDTAVARAVALGQQIVSCSSTGNLARAVAVSAQARDMRAVLFVPEDLPDDLVEILMGLGAEVVKVQGSYDTTSRFTAEVASELPSWGWVNISLRPWYELGARTLAFEIAEQNGWRFPDRVVVPMASGALARALFDGFRYLADLGLVKNEMPKLTVVEPEGCAPVAAAFTAGDTLVRPVRPNTQAESLAMGDPPDGEAVLAAARASGGEVVSAPEDEIVAAANLVQKTEGLSAELAGGVVVAALRQLALVRTTAPDEHVVAVMTGGTRRATEWPVVSARGSTYTIKPSVGALMAALPPGIVRN